MTPVIRHFVGAKLLLLETNKIDAPYPFISKLDVEIYWRVLNVLESPYDTDTNGTKDPDTF